MSKAMVKLRSHPDYPNVSDTVIKEYAIERLMELAVDKKWIDDEISILKEELEKTNESLRGDQT